MMPTDKKTFKAVVILALTLALFPIFVCRANADSLGIQILSPVHMPSQLPPLDNNGIVAGIGIVSIEGTNPMTVSFSTEQQGYLGQSGNGRGNFAAVGISVDDGPVYLVGNSVNETIRPLPYVSQPPPFNSPPSYDFTEIYNVTLDQLPIGEHEVTVYLGNRAYNIPSPLEFWVYTYASAKFLVSTPPITTPVITKLSIENNTYTGNLLPLTFNINGTVSWMGFSIDNRANVTLYGNVTLTDLAEGNHSLIVYANDSLGDMGKSDTVFFDIAFPTPSPTLEPTPSPITTPSPSVPEFPNWIILPIMAAAAITIVCFKRRKL